MPNRNYSPHSKRRSAPPKKIMDVKAPADFPAVGRTLSTYKPNIANPPQAVPPKKRLTRRKVIKRTVLVIVLVALLSGGWVGWKFYKNFGGFNGIVGLLHSTKLKGEDTGRVNILLAGNSADDPGHQGANLTDSIMIVSIDTRDNTAFMLSIPRDLYVSLPDGSDPDYTGHGKINQAILDNNFSKPGYPNGGMGNLEYILSQDLGIPIDYYALIDYGAFRDAVNAVGGITVNINSPDGQLYDPSIDYSTGGPLVDHLYNGEHTLNGQQALDLARARGDAYGSIGFEQSDFQRTADQRMMLVALEKKALSAGVLANPVKLGDLFDSIGKNVHTDLTLSNMHRLYDLSKKFGGANNIQSLTLSDSGNNALLTNYTTPTTPPEDALIPSAGLDDYSQIQAYMQQITAVSPKSNK